jgi:uncharacterized protein (DUF58 family)
MEILVLFLVMLVLMAVQSIIYKKLSFKGLRYHCEFSTDEVFEGTEVFLTETVENQKWLPLPWFKSEITTSKWLDFAGAQSVVTYHTRFVPSFFLVKGHKKVTRHWKVACVRRGVFSIESVMLVSTDLLGSRTVSRPALAGASITVLPKPLPLHEFTLQSRYLLGEHLVRFQLVPDPFLVSGVREYLPSDPMKSIHWNATAKMGRIMVRNQEYTTRQCVMVLLNIQSNEYEREKGRVDPDGVENCIRAAAAVFEAALEDSIPVSFAVNWKLDGEYVKEEAAFGREYILELHRLMARIPDVGGENFSRFLEEIPVQSEVTDLIIVTTYLNEGIFDFCRQQKENGRTVRVLLLRATSWEIPEDCNVYLLRREVLPDAGNIA